MTETDSITSRTESRAVFIYSLIDPRTNETRYVGKSIRPQQRLQNHMNERSNCHRSHWLQGLKHLGLTPAMTILEKIPAGADWQEAECRWIAALKSSGARLTNNTIGGDGVTGLPPETRERMRQTWVGRKHSPETIAKLGAWKRHPVLDSTRAKHSAAMKGRKITWVETIAERLRKITPEKSLEIKARLSAGELVKDLAREFGVHRTTMSKIKMGTYFIFGQHPE